MLIRDLGCQEYTLTLQQMQEFTTQRHANTIDELWLVEHPAVYTQGQAGKAEHIRNPGNIPIIQSDRGGQVTYHGPGQLVAYVLFDLQRRKLGIRTLVQQLEHCCVQLLSNFSITAHVQHAAPGVYVEHKKIASIGLRVKKGCTYHGIALNVCVDLEPFLRINPCGNSMLRMTSMQEHVAKVSLFSVKEALIHAFLTQFGV